MPDTAGVMTTSKGLHAALATLLTQGVGNLLPDGTLWSHAAVLGEFVQGTKFILREDDLRNMERVFKSGYPRKVPIDYEHETALKDPAHVAEDEAPYTRRAGDVIEVVAVLKASDLNDAMTKQVADEEARRAELGVTNLDPVNAMGLWVRWVPTALALELIQSREVTEMSIVFHPNYPHNETGKGQGPTLLSVALTNTPFLDGMLSVAASRGSGVPPAAPAATAEENTMSASLKERLGIVLSRIFATDEAAADAAAENITTLRSQVTALTKHQDTVQALSRELGVTEPDPAKLLTSVQSLKQKVATIEDEAKKAKEATVTLTVNRVLKAHEGKLSSVPVRDHFARTLRAELEGGAKEGETPTEQVLKSLSASPALEQKSAADGGGSSVTDDEDVRLDAMAKEIMDTDVGVKALASRAGHTAAFTEALRLARRKLRTATAGAGTEVVTAGAK